MPMEDLYKVRRERALAEQAHADERRIELEKMAVAEPSALPAGPKAHVSLFSVLGALVGKRQKGQDLGHS